MPYECFMSPQYSIYKKNVIWKDEIHKFIFQKHHIAKLAGHSLAVIIPIWFYMYDVMMIVWFYMYVFM